MNKLISVIIPVYNAEKYIERCLRSIKTSFYKHLIEVVIVDDCSKDKTYKTTKSIISKLQTEFSIDFFLYKTAFNRGPGIARNVGIARSKGEYILFVDSDDALSENALDILVKKCLEYPADMIVFDYMQTEQGKEINGGGISIVSGARKDLEILRQSKTIILSEFIQSHMTSFVLCNLIRRNLILNNNVVFNSGYHEDVDFIFILYFYANKIIVLDDVLYFKYKTDSNITGSISIKHIKGFFRAFIKIKKMIKSNAQFNDYWNVGIKNLTAVKLREIYMMNVNKKKLYHFLYLTVKKMPIDNTNILQTQYHHLYKNFIDTYSTGKFDDVEIGIILQKKWSCYDLHNSLFLCPNEIRVCCKRFFKDNKICGDIVLVNLKTLVYDKINDLTDKIFSAKQKLYDAINTGNPCSCTGCPHLEFKEWGLMLRKIKKLSFEQHTICNLHCIYCSDIYYGGEHPCYNVKDLVTAFINESIVDNLQSCVFGGGEPVLGRDFEPILGEIVNVNPEINPIVITNSTQFSQKIKELLIKKRIRVITSIDAASPKIYELVRGKDCLNNVLKNLKQYACNASTNIIIKYIILHENSEIAELKQFVKNIIDYNLTACSFQISCDFKKQKLENYLLRACVILYALLYSSNVKIIFFDELLRERIPRISSELISNLINELKNSSLPQIIELPQKHKEIILWGSGNQVLTLLNNSYFFQFVKVAAIVHTDSERIGSLVNGIAVSHPIEYLNSDIPIIISAVQGTQAIYDEFVSMGFNKDRLIRKLIL